MSVVGSEPKLEWFKINRVGFLLWILEWFYMYFFIPWLITFQLFEGPPVSGFYLFVRGLEYSSRLCNNNPKVKMISWRQ